MLLIGICAFLLLVHFSTHTDISNQAPNALETKLACKKRQDDTGTIPKQSSTAKKPRLVFTDLQRRTLQAIFKETKRPTKEMQITISQQLGLDISTVGNFFMNARRRSQDKWLDDNIDTSKQASVITSPSKSSSSSSSSPSSLSSSRSPSSSSSLSSNRQTKTANTINTTVISKSTASINPVVTFSVITSS